MSCFCIKGFFDDSLKARWILWKARRVLHRTIISYFPAYSLLHDQKDLLGIRIVITNLHLEENFYFTESEAKDILIIAVQFSDTRRRRRQHDRSQSAGYLMRLLW
jgi:hypothetical protein